MTETAIAAFYTAVRVRDDLAGTPLWLNEDLPRPTCQESAEHDRCTLALFHDGEHHNVAGDAGVLNGA